MKIIDRREMFRSFPGPDVLEKIISQLGPEGLKDVNSVILLDTDKNAKWHHGLTAKTVPSAGTKMIDIEIYYEGATMPEALLASPIFNTYVFAKAFLSELYQHIALGKAGKESAETTLRVNAIQEWALADAQKMLAQLYPPNEHKGEYSQLNEIIKKERQS